MNTKMNYTYRDADNYKSSTEIVISGEITEEQVARIVAKLDADTYFIPEQLGLPAKRLDDYPYDPEADHPYCELIGFESTNLDATEDLTVDGLVAAFEAVESWDESLDVFAGRPIRQPAAE